MFESELSCNQLRGQSQHSESFKRTGWQSCQDLRYPLANCYFFYPLSNNHDSSCIICSPHATAIATPKFHLQQPNLNKSSPLECLQVAPPIAVASAACQQTLMVYTFAFAYGQPFIGTSKSCCDRSVALYESYTFVLAQTRDLRLTDAQGTITHLNASTTV